MNRSQLLAASSVLALSSVAGSAAFAQDLNVEQVVVSASRVTIAGYTQPTPVTVIGAAQLQTDGYTNIAQSIAQLPSVGNFNAPSGANANPGNALGGTGGWEINLRNLGLLRTLTLIDGQRIVANSINAGGSDIGTVPAGLIQRIDVVTGGASAAWGSDAVAGVVNIVLNKNFTGFKAEVVGSDSSYNNPGYETSVTWGTGFANDRGHFEMSFRHEDDPVPVWNIENEPPPIFMVSNPAYTATNGQPQLIHMYAPNRSLQTDGGLINASPKGTTAPANALRGIQFLGPQATVGNYQFGTVPTTTGGAIAPVMAGGTSNPTDQQGFGFPMAVPPYHTTSVFLYSKYKVTDTVVASAEFSWNTSRPDSDGGNNEGFYQSIGIKSGNPFIPAAVQAAMTAGGITSFTMGTSDLGDLPAAYHNNLPSLDAQGLTTGEVLVHNQNQVMRGVVSLDGTLGSDWSWSAYYQHGHTAERANPINNTIKANLLNALDAVTAPAGNTAGLPVGTIVCRDTLTNPNDGCYPINFFGTGNVSALAHQYLMNPGDVTRYSLTQDVAEGSMQGTLPWGFEAGKIATAFGVGYRKEAGYGTGNAIAAAQGYVNGNSGNFKGSYNIIEGFGELDIPILKNNIVQSLDASAAGRMTSYSTSGLVETWKMGLTSQVNDDIRLRTTWSLDIRAPNIYELFNTPSGSNSVQADPKTTAPVSVAMLVGGNANLNPEVSTTLSGGIVLTPTFVPGLSLSADWYSINIKKAVYTLSGAFILNQCAANLSSPYCAYITFAGGPNGQGGQLISAISTTPQNAAAQTESGLDFEANYTMDLFSGSLAWHLVGNYTDEETQIILGQPNIDYAGVVGGNLGFLGVPKLHSTLSATYTEGPWSGTVQGRYIGHSRDQFTQTVDYTGVSAVAYLDVRGSYNWNDHVQIFGAMDNVTGTQPPLVAYLVTAFTGPRTSPIYDKLGRVYRVGVRFNY